ncbi:MAG: hypothetical protein AAB784_00195 [Patescibacteria group bacterium]
MSFESNINNLKEKESPLEKLGNKTLTRESAMAKNGLLFKTTTVLALLMGAGIFSEKAEAQVRGVGPQNGWLGQVVSETIHRGVFKATSSMDRKRGREKEELEEAYSQAMHQLKTERSAAYWDRAKNKISQEDYLQIKGVVESKMLKVEEAYQKEIRRKNNFKKGVFEEILRRGVQGY